MLGDNFTLWSIFNCVRSNLEVSIVKSIILSNSSSSVVSDVSA